MYQIYILACALHGVDVLVQANLDLLMIRITNDVEDSLFAVVFNIYFNIFY